MLKVVALWNTLIITGSSDSETCRTSCMQDCRWKFHSRWLSTEGSLEELLLFTKRFKLAVTTSINQPMRIFEFKILPPPKV
jgi:hypothetical protein